MKIIPRGKYVLVKAEELEAKENEVGLLMPSNEEVEEKAQGVVIEVGEVKDIKKGDRVVYGAFAGEKMEVTEKGKKVEYKLLHDDDIIAFIR